MSGKILTFPTPYPDEELRSIIYRYVIRKGCTYKNGVRELLNINVNRIAFLPNNLLYLYEKLPSSLFSSLSELIDKHTFYPLYSPFLSETNRIKVYERMARYEKNQQRETKVVSSILSREVKYCSLCMEEDESRYGEVYIHRSHQVLGIDICYLHQIELISRCPHCNVVLGDLYRDFFLGNNICGNGHSLESRVNIYSFDELAEVKLILSKQINSILNGNIQIDKLYDSYAVLAQIKGYKKNGVYMNNKFRNEIVDANFELMLKKINTITKIHSSNSALNFFDENKAVRNPVYHLLVIQKLIGGIEKLHTVVNAEKFNNELVPFGSGPWPCINKICSMYLSPSISTCQLNYSNEDEEYIGVFSCKKCGMTYQSRCNKKSMKVKLNKKIINYGQKWKECLDQLLKSGMSVRAMSQNLGIHHSLLDKYIYFTVEGDPYNITEIREKKGSLDWILKLYEIYDAAKSITQIAIYLETSNKIVHKYLDDRRTYVEGSNALINEIACASEVTSEIDEYKELIHIMINSIPNVTRVQLRKLIGKKIYGYLMKREREWMETVLPQSQIGKERYDYITEDEILSKKIDLVCKKIYENPPNKQIKKYTIINELSTIDRKRIVEMSDVFPKSISVLQQYVETRENFQLRIIPYAVQLYSDYTLNYLLALHKFRNCSDKVKESLKEQYERRND